MLPRPSVTVAFHMAPTPLLPSHPEWIAAYWQSWQGDQNPAAAIAALAQVRALRGRGLEDEAFAAASEFMDAAAAGLLCDAEGAQQTASRWPALATLLVEEILGVTWTQSGLAWELRLEPPVGLHDLQIGDAMISLIAEADTGAGIVVSVTTTAPIDLTIRTQFTTFHEWAPAGKTRYLLTYLDRTDIVGEDN